MSEAEERDDQRFPSSVRVFLQRLYRDPRYVLIGKVERYGQDRIAFIEACAMLSAAGEVRGQALMNDEYFLDGRPDGERPFGEDSLLDHYLSVSGEGKRHLDEDDLMVLREESWQHYVRRNFHIQLRDYARARDDAEHNLGLIGLVEQSDTAEEAKWSMLKWWPWIERDRAIAQALWHLQHGERERAAAELYRSVRAVEQFARRHAEEYAQEEQEGESLCAGMRQHLQSLIELLRREERMPVSVEEQLDEALARGDREEAERLRAEMIRKAMEEGE